MSEPQDHTAQDVVSTPHSDAHHTDAHDGAAGHDAPDHHDEPLGPIDWPAWAAGVLGVAIGLLVAFVFGQTTGLL